MKMNSVLFRIIFVGCCDDIMPCIATLETSEHELRAKEMIVILSYDDFTLVCRSYVDEIRCHFVRVSTRCFLPEI